MDPIDVYVYISRDTNRLLMLKTFFVHLFILARDDWVQCIADLTEIHRRVCVRAIWLFCGGNRAATWKMDVDGCGEAQKTPLIRFELKQIGKCDCLPYNWGESVDCFPFYYDFALFSSVCVWMTVPESRSQTIRMCPLWAIRLSRSYAMHVIVNEWPPYSRVDQAIDASKFIII